MKNLQQLFAENLANNEVRVLPQEHDKDDVLLKEVIDSVPNTILGERLSNHDKYGIIERAAPFTFSKKEDPKLIYVISANDDDKLTVTILDKKGTDELKFREERLLRPNEVEFTTINKSQENSNHLKTEIMDTEKKFNYPLSSNVKNALTGASITGYEPEKKNVEVRMADASYLKLQVTDRTADYLKNNPEMPKLQIKDVKMQSLELGKTFIELTPDAVKFLNGKFQEKSLSIPEKLKIGKDEITLTPDQRKDIGSGKPVNIGKLGNGKDDLVLMINPNENNKIIVMKAFKEAVPQVIEKSQAPGQSMSANTDEKQIKQEQRIRREPATKGQSL